MKLAVVGRISVLENIPGADRIQRAQIDCGEEGSWSCVVGKPHAINELMTVFLQDAVLPEDDRWAFMKSHKWRVRMARFKGVPSEAVALPLIVTEGVTSDVEPGFDQTQALGVTKHTKPLPKEMVGVAKANFPSFIPRTDEPNFQRVDYTNLMLDSHGWVATTKFDGTSCTVWVDDAGEIHVCSSNLELEEFSESGASNLYWETARNYFLGEIQPGYALQFEIIGPKIQGNKLQLEERQIRVFKIWNIEKQCYLGHDSLINFCTQNGLPIATIEARGVNDIDADELRDLANIEYVEGVPGEGVVIHDIEGKWSFKVLNLAYKEAA